MIKHRIRLQGYSFIQMKPKLTLLPDKTIISNRGNICIITKDESGQEYTHWLNDIEKEKFQKGELLWN